MQNKERPILFSTPMVNAINENRKIQTRRKIKFPCNWTPEKVDDWLAIADFYPKFKCPYGNIGDILWVRETFTVLEPEHCEGMSDRFYYKAGHHETNEDWRLEAIRDGYPYKWKPCLFMPREACRLLLKINNIRVERLQDISEEDAIREGITKFGPNHWLIYDKTWDISKVAIENGADPITNSPLKSFQSLWTSINGMESWNLNPWVWVIEFEKIKQSEING